MSVASISPPVTSRRRARLGIAALAVLGLTAGLSGCGSASEAAQKLPGEGFVIGVAQASTEVPFLATLDAAIRDQAEGQGMEVVILDGGFDSATQAENIRTLVKKEVDAILVISSDPTVVLEPIAAAADAGIPVFAVNARLDKSAEIVSYIGASDYDYGKAQGRLLAEALPDGGDIAVILGPLGGTPQVERLAGLQSELGKHPGIRVLEQPTDDFDATKNLAVTQDLLARYAPGAIDAIVAQGPQLYAGADWAAEQGRDDVLFIAGDYPTQVEDSIRSGALYGTVDQSPVLEGRLGAQYAFWWLTNERSKVKAPEYLIPLPAIRSDDVDDTPSAWSF